MHRKRYSPLVNWAGRLLKFFAIVLFGFGITYVFSMVLGVPQVASLLVFLCSNLLWRFAVIVFGILGATAFFESIRT